MECIKRNFDSKDAEQGRRAASAMGSPKRHAPTNSPMTAGHQVAHFERPACGAFDALYKAALLPLALLFDAAAPAHMRRGAHRQHAALACGARDHDVSTCQPMTGPGSAPSARPASIVARGVMRTHPSSTEPQLRPCTSGHHTGPHCCKLTGPDVALGAAQCHAGWIFSAQCPIAGRVQLYTMETLVFYIHQGLGGCLMWRHPLAQRVGVTRSSSRA